MRRSENERSLGVEKAAAEVGVVGMEEVMEEGAGGEGTRDAREEEAIIDRLMGLFEKSDI